MRRRIGLVKRPMPAPNSADFTPSVQDGQIRRAIRADNEVYISQRVANASGAHLLAKFVRAKFRQIWHE
jgi:hypothetical protein